MEIYIEPNCAYKTELANLKSHFEGFLEKLFMQNGLTTIKKVIITNMETDKYSLSINTHSIILRKHVHPPSETSCGMVIDGLDKNGEYTQIVFFHETIILACYMENSRDNIGYEILYHEIGHAIDNQNLFKSYDYISPDKIYDITSERFNYIKEESLKLWSEYYAQRVYVKYYNKPSRIADSENITECIISPFLNNSIYDLYRIAYTFVIYIAYYHHNNFKIPFFEKGIKDNKKLYCYFNVLKKLANVLDDLYKRFGKWNFDKEVNNLASVYENLVIIDFQSLT